MATLPVVDSGEFTRSTAGVSVLPVLCDTGEFTRPTTGVGVLPLTIDTGEFSRPGYGVGVLPQINTGDPPLNFAATMTGGMRMTGTAPRSFVLNGVPVNDPSAYLITPSGGMQVSGSAPVTAILIDKFEIWPLGGTKLTGAAPISVNWSTRVMMGGMRMAGTAPVVFRSDSVSGTIANRPLPKLTASLGIYGISGVLPKLVSALGPEGIGGNIVAALPALAGSFTGIVGQAGTTDVALPMLRSAFEGGQSGLDARLPSLRGALTGGNGSVATINAQLPRLTSSQSAGAYTLATMNAALPAIAGQFDALAGAIATIAAQLPRIRGGVAGYVGVSGTLHGTLHPITAVLGGAAQVTGAMAVRLPSMRADLAGYLATQQVATFVMNTINNALTEYQQYPYNSFAEIDGQYYAAGPTGLYLLEGDDDNGTDINASLRFGLLHFGSEFNKRVTDFYAAMRATEDMTLRITVDENDPVEVTISPLDVATIKQRRVKTPKGLKGKYWQFELENTEGGDFDFDTFNIAAIPLNRRI